MSSSGNLAGWAFRAHSRIFLSGIKAYFLMKCRINGKWVELERHFDVSARVGGLGAVLQCFTLLCAMRRRSWPGAGG